MVDRQVFVDIGDRHFIIEKLPAARNYALLIDILTKGLPVGLIGSAMESFLPASALDYAKSSGKTMTVEDVEALQLAFMSAVSERLPAMPVKVVDVQGHFQVDGVEDDMLLFGKLLVQSIKHQYLDFFTENLSKLGIKMPDGETLKANLLATF